MRGRGANPNDQPESSPRFSKHSLEKAQLPPPVGTPVGRRSTAHSADVPLRVVELTAFHIHIPLRKPIRHASHARTATDNVLVRCVLENKTEGYGEGVPRVDDCFGDSGDGWLQDDQEPGGAGAAAAGE